MGYPDDELQADPFKSGRIATGDILGGHSSRADLLNSQAEAQREDAFAMMQRALNNAPQVTAEQGIAAALLAAIPTLGGAFLGKKVGQSSVPQGMYGVKSLAPTGMAAGGMAGAEIGNEAAQGFLKRLDRTAVTTPILEAQAQYLNQQANQTAQQANAVENARLAAQTNIDMMPLEEAKQMRINAASAANSFENARRLKALTDSADVMRPEARAAAAQALGLDPSKEYTTNELRVVTAAQEAARRNEGQEERFARADESLNIPGAIKREGFRPAPKAVYEAQVALQNYGELSKIHIPELKRVFSSPNVTTDEQSAALAGAVVAIKNQQKMGANFTGLEENLVKAGLPRIAEISIGDMSRFLKAELQGQDALAKINRLESIVNATVQNQLFPLGYSLAPQTTDTQDPMAAKKAEIDAKIAALEAQLNGR